MASSVRRAAATEAAAARRQPGLLCLSGPQRQPASFSLRRQHHFSQRHLHHKSCCLRHNQHRSNSTLAAPSPPLSPSSSSPPVFVIPPPPPAVPARGQSWSAVLSSSELWWSLLLVVQFTSLAYWFRHEVADIMSCVGPSMLPTMNLSGDVVLIRRLSASAYQRGDVVVAASVLNPRLMVCKRIIALPGDTITVHKPTPELPFPAASAFPYSPSSAAAVELKLPTGHCWLQGDNTPNSSDSRLYGPVPLAMLVGRVEYRLWPLTQAGRIKRTMAYSGQDKWSREEELEKRRRADETVEAGDRSSGRRMPSRGGMQVLAESDSRPRPAAVEDSAALQPSRELRDGNSSVSVSILRFTPAKRRSETADK